MKRSFKMWICLLLVCSFVLTGCGEFKPAIEAPHKNSTETQAPDSSSGSDTEPNDQDAPFTVMLSFEGETYIPSAETPIYVHWNDGFSFHKAQIGTDGVAQMTGLDGDYQVTLSDIPDGYAYNPSAYVATNNKRNVTIELYRLVSTTGKGASLYNCIPLRYTGLYRVELEDAKDEIFFEFAPPESGTYSVISWVDTTANEINPMANYYGANAFFKQLQFVADDGGAESSYTKNFKLDVQIADEMIGNGGQVTFSFGIQATSKNGEYPAEVYFAIMLDGEFSLNTVTAPLICPQEDLHLMHAPEYDPNIYKFVGAEVSKTVGGNTASVFDGTRYKLWTRENGVDGFYHVYDETEYAATGGYGPVLYAYISQPCRFLDAAFTGIEMRGNKALTVHGKENYKLFIEGFGALLVDPPGDNGPYFCTTNCPCRNNGTCIGACTEACTNCHPDCRRCPEEAMGALGYGNICNSDGVCAVTQELKEFLQKYSTSQLLFFDGNGFVETHPDISVYAAEDDQWLFACGYYVER